MTRKLVAIVGRKLLADVISPLVNKPQENSEALAADIIISREANRQPARARAVLPANAVLVTTSWKTSLSISCRMRATAAALMKTRKDRVENYESMNID